MARRRSGKKIDFTHWTGWNFLAGAVASGGTSASLISAAQHLPETILRTRGNFVAWMDGAQAAAVSAQMGMGLILVPEGTGTTVLWSPLTDADAPWFWYESFHIGFELINSDGDSYTELSGFRGEIDSKAMRIVKNMEVQMVVETVAQIGTFVTNFQATGRFLTGT